jgi:DNA repair protein RecO (recombination protein O)
MGVSAELSTQSGYLLHRQPWQENAELLDCLTPDFGRILLVRNRPKNNLPMFQRLELSFTGNSEFRRLKEWTIEDRIHLLQGDRLYIGLYLNELLVRLSNRDDPNPAIFGLYSSTLHLVTNTETDANSLEGALRFFEHRLLQEQGYGVDFERDHSGLAIDPNGHYQHITGQGFVSNSQGNLLGSELLAIHQNDWQHPDVRRKAKGIFRAELNERLQGQPLRSRQLLQNLKSKRG